MDVYVSVNGVTELASTGPLQGSSAASAELWGMFRGRGDGGLRDQGATDTVGP